MTTDPIIDLAERVSALRRAVMLLLGLDELDMYGKTRRAMGIALRTFATAGVTPEQVVEVVSAYRREHPHVRLGVRDLVNLWPELVTPNEDDPAPVSWLPGQGRYAPTVTREEILEKCRRLTARCVQRTIEDAAPMRGKQWLGCNECGEARLYDDVGKFTSGERVWPRCKTTPGCDGRLTIAVNERAALGQPELGLHEQQGRAS